MIINEQQPNGNITIPSGTPGITFEDGKLRGIANWDIVIPSKYDGFVRYVSFTRVSAHLDWIVETVESLDSSGSNSLTSVTEISRHLAKRSPDSYGHSSCLKKKWSAGAKLKVDNKYYIICFDQSTHDLTGVLESDLKSLSVDMNIVSRIFFAEYLGLFGVFDMLVPVDCASHARKKRES